MATSLIGGLIAGGCPPDTIWVTDTEQSKLGDLQAPRTFRQEVGAEILPITLQERDGRIHGRMKQAALRLSPPIADPEPLARALGLARHDILSDPAPRAQYTRPRTAACVPSSSTSRCR